MIDKPLLSLCMIVKNEEANLPRCLESVKGVVDEMVIVDTGSTDRTKEIAQSYGAKVYDFEWVDDFSAARNYGIDRAKGEWILVLDADEVLDAQTAIELRPILETSKADAYNCVTRNVLSLQPELYYHDSSFQGWVRVFRNRPQYRFESMYHEAVFPSLLRHKAKVENSNFIIWHYGLLCDMVQGGETTREERSWRYLQKAAEQEPNNGNLLFYLGVGYYEKGDRDNAYKVLKRAVFHAKTELAHPYYTKRGLLILGEIAQQRGEYELAAGCAKGCLAVEGEGYTELDTQAWQMLFNSVMTVVQNGVNQSLAIANRSNRNRRLTFYLNLLKEFSGEVEIAMQSKPANLSEQYFAFWLDNFHRIGSVIEKALAAR